VITVEFRPFGSHAWRRFDTFGMVTVATKAVLKLGALGYEARFRLTGEAVSLS
jgi:hypothetical protein